MMPPPAMQCPPRLDLKTDFVPFYNERVTVLSRLSDFAHIRGRHQ